MFLDYKTLLAEQLDAHIALIAFNRPKQANALNMQMALELANAFETIADESNGLRCVILTGQGKHFCAGADLKERKGMTEEAWHEQHEAFEKAMLSILNCPLPVLAAVGGAAYGGGFELALACDFIYASYKAKFALSETSLGIIPGMGGTQQLARRIGKARAKEAVFSAQPISAEESHRLGIINKLCSTDTLLFETMNSGKAIAKNAPLAVQAAKQAINEGADLPLADALDNDLSYYNNLLKTDDRHEGINAFNAKKKPEFTGS